MLTGAASPGERAAHAVWRLGAEKLEAGRELWDLLAAIDAPEWIAHVFDDEETCAQAPAWLERCEQLPDAGASHAWFLYHGARCAAVTDPQRSKRCLALAADAFASRGDAAARMLVDCALLEMQTHAGSVNIEARRHLARQVRAVLAEKALPIRFRLGAAVLDCAILAGGDAEGAWVETLDAELHGQAASLAIVDWCVASAEWQIRRRGELAAAEALLRKALQFVGMLGGQMSAARVQNLLAAVLMARESLALPLGLDWLLPSHRLDDVRRANLARLKALFLEQPIAEAAHAAPALALAVDRAGPAGYRIEVASVCAEAGMHAMARDWLQMHDAQAHETCRGELADAALLLKGWELAVNGHEAQAVEVVRAPLARQAARNRSALFPYAPRLAATLIELGFVAGVDRDWLRRIVAAQELRAPRETSPSWPWPIRAHVLGIPEVYLNGELVRISGKTQQRVWELLCLLAASGPLGKPQAFVARQLWGESEAPMAALRVAIHRLRKLLGSEEAVVVSNGLVALNSSIVWSDLQALLDFCDRITDGSVDALASHSRRKADLLLRLYRGAIFCAESLPWVLAVQRKVSAQFVAAASLLAERLEAHADWAGASRVYRRMLDPEPLSETAYRGLMRCAAAAGDMAAAFSHYRFCRDTLSVVLGRDVSPETRYLAEDLGFIEPASPRPLAPRSNTTLATRP